MVILYFYFIFISYMDTSIHTIINGNKRLIVCFGGINLRFGGILPFDFLNYLSTNYDNVDFIFVNDLHRCVYQKGLKDITENTDETVAYLDNIIKSGNYDKVLFMGTSTGGYASILFGSLCHIDAVISFVPYTIVKNYTNIKYSNLKNIINDTTQYVVYGNTLMSNTTCANYILHNDIDKDSSESCEICIAHRKLYQCGINCGHNIAHCNNINNFKNVRIIRNRGYDMEQLIESGSLKKYIDDALLAI